MCSWSSRRSRSVMVIASIVSCEVTIEPVVVDHIASPRTNLAQNSLPRFASFLSQRGTTISLSTLAKPLLQYHLYALGSNQGSHDIRHPALLALLLSRGLLKHWARLHNFCFDIIVGQPYQGLDWIPDPRLNNLTTWRPGYGCSQTLLRQYLAEETTP